MPPPAYVNISDGETLWRRIHIPDFIVTNPDGTRRVSSAAFKHSADDEDDISVSVHIAALTTLEGVFNVPPPCVAIAEILAVVPRSLGHEVRHTPTDDDASHASIVPPATYRSNRKKTDAKVMAKASRLIER